MTGTHRRRRALVAAPRARVVAAALVVVTVLGVGVATAYWTASATGSGTATTGTPARVVLAPGTPTDDLFPGGSTDVALVISNPGTSSVSVATITFDPLGGFTVDAAHAACDVDALTFERQDNAGAGWIVPARTGGVDGSLPVTLPGALSMSVDAGNACQGAQFTVYLMAGS